MNLMKTFFSLHCFDLLFCMELWKLLEMDEEYFGFEVKKMGLGK